MSEGTAARRAMANDGTGTPLIRQARQALARGQLAEAEGLAGRALQAHSGAAARDVMARVHLRQKRPEAAAGLLAPIAEDPATPVETLILLGNALWQSGEQERARDTYELAVTRNPESGVAWMSHCMTQLPFLYDDEAHLMTCRTRYAQRLAEMAVHFRAGGSERLARLFPGVSAAMPFRTAYQGLETRALQAAYGALVGEAAAARFPALAAPLPPRPAGRLRIRLAIVSAFYKDHSVWKIPLKGFVYGLDRRHFELVHFHLAGGDNPVSLELRQLGDKVVTGAGGLAQWLQQLRAAEPDAVFFPEFGMDGMTAMIAAVRSAPLQMLTLGHPDSCGLPSMDCYLSSELMEPPDGDDHYTERLVRLPGTAITYDPPARAHSSLGRADFGLERGDVVYWFGHQIKKPLPRHDSLFPRIAREVPESRFVFLNWAAEPLMARFRARMDRAFSQYGLDYRRYCRFLDKQAPSAFDALLRASDVFLDCPDWQGNNSTHEALAQGLPVITCPGRFMRARHTVGILTRLGLTAAIAVDVDGLVRLAIRLGRDPVLRQALGDHIRRNVWRLYRDRAPVEALQDFLIEATAGAPSA